MSKRYGRKQKRKMQQEVISLRQDKTRLELSSVEDQHKIRELEGAYFRGQKVMIHCRNLDYTHLPPEQHADINIRTEITMPMFCFQSSLNRFDIECRDTKSAIDMLVHEVKHELSVGIDKQLRKAFAKALSERRE